MAAKIKKFKKVPVDVPVKDLTPLNINCGSTKCEAGLHCFRMTKREIEKLGTSGICKTCGADLINWKRIRKQNPKDAKFIFQSLKSELIRHVFWHLPINQRDIDKALKIGSIEVENKIIDRMTKTIGIANPYRNGYTPYSGNVIFYAQHATATCCRRCMEYWYDIPMGKPLTKDEISFSKDLIQLYLKERVPELFEQSKYANIE